MARKMDSDAEASTGRVEKIELAGIPQATGRRMLKLWLVLLFGMLSTAMFAGCGETPEPAAEEPVPADTTTEASVELTEEQLETLAEAQRVCAVSGEPLGSMGKPLPVQVTSAAGEKRTVFLCCESCREPLLENPDRYLAQLDSAKTDTPTDN